MSFFKLTIAEDMVEKRTESYKNLTSMLSAFLITFSVSIISGAWYLFVPHEINWNASQIILLLHLAGGVMSFMFFVIYFILHQKDKEQKLSNFILPWSLRKEPDEEDKHFKQRILGIVLTWLMLIIYTSGFILAIPGAVFYLGYVWVYSFDQLMLLDGTHALATLALVPVLLIHFLWLSRK